jgi:hypothetical protein
MCPFSEVRLARRKSMEFPPQGSFFLEDRLTVDNINNHTTTSDNHPSELLNINFRLPQPLSQLPSTYLHNGE